MFRCVSSKKLMCQGICRLAKRLWDHSLSSQACWYIPTRQKGKVVQSLLARCIKMHRLQEMLGLQTQPLHCSQMFLLQLLQVAFACPFAVGLSGKIGVMDSMESHCRPRWLRCWDPVAKICSAFRKPRPGCQWIIVNPQMRNDALQQCRCATDACFFGVSAVNQLSL